MAAPVNVTSTVVSKGNREDLEDVIYKVAQKQTPFLQAIGNVKAKGATHEWQIEDLDPVNTGNAQVEGDAFTIDAPNLTTRVGNITQTFRKTGAVTGRQEAVTSAGRSSDYKRQLVIKGQSMMRDMEAIMLANQGSSPGSATVAPLLGGALAWLTSNVSRGASGASGGAVGSAVTAATPGTLRAFAEQQIKDVMQACFVSGAAPSILLMGSALKQKASAFSGLAQARRETGDDMVTIVAGADVYVSDYGALQFVPHPYALTRDALVIEPGNWAVAPLRPTQTVDIAKTADADQFAILTEKTLVCRNQKASGVIADIQ